MPASKPLSTLVGVLAIAIPGLTIPTRGTEAADRRVCLFDFYVVGTGASVLCEEPQRAVVVDTACQAFEPIRYSRASDTPETIRQVREHNAAWDALCKAK